MSTGWIEMACGSVGPTVLSQIRATVGPILDIPG
jgi:hypothetical protein